MGNPQTAETAAALRLLPSTDDVLSTAVARELSTEVGASRLTQLARMSIQEVREDLIEKVSSGAARAEIYSKDGLLALASAGLQKIWDARKAARIRKVINATGVVIHTNLGRAPLSDDAIKAIGNAAGYANLEYDLTTGKRGRRGESVESRLIEVTGAGGALIVNNCAAAAFLVLTVFAKGGEVVISRGELVEIGGDFRIPDVLVQSGAKLREVGTTNRTKLSDYEKAIGENTKVVMRVHPSNYKIVGFTERPSLADLAKLSHRHGLVLFDDAGSGALLDLSGEGLGDEPLIGGAISDGADIVTFSGDKLLGGAQAGIIVGRSELIEQLRKHPLYRALRVDKLIYAALEATLESYLREDARQNVPVLRMLALGNDEIEARAHDLAKRLNGRGLLIDVVAGESVVGGGSGPAVKPETTLLSLRHAKMTASEIELNLRTAGTPVIARIESDNVLLDLRTVQPDEENTLLEILRSVLT